MTTVNVDDLIVRLQQRRAAHGDGRDCRSANERAAWWSVATDIDHTVSGLMNAPTDLAREQRKLDDLEAERVAATQKHAELAEELVSAPNLSTFADARERDRERERQHQLQRMLERLAEGTLLRTPGTVFRSLAYLDTRIAEVTEQRDRAQRALDGLVQQAEALLAAQSVAS